MYCYNCGSELSDKAVICPNCGTVVNEQALRQAYEARDRQQQAQAQTAPQSQPAASPTNVLAIVGFVLSFFIGIAGLVCSCIGLSHSKKMNGKGKGLAIAGIVIGCVSIVCNLIAGVYGITEYLYYPDYVYPYL